MPHDPDRRRFLGASAVACAALAGCDVTDPSPDTRDATVDTADATDTAPPPDTQPLPDTQPPDTTPPPPQTLTVSLEEHPDLRTPRTAKAFPGKETGLRRGVLIYHTISGDFIAMNDACTHHNCIVHIIAENEQYDCPCHRSLFSFDGTVLRGPAEQNLRRFEVTVDGDLISVHLP